MRLPVLVGSLLLVAAPLAGQAPTSAPATPPSVALPPALDRVLRDYERGWRAGDAKAVAALFTDDGFALSNGRPAAQGHEAIAAGYAGPGSDLHLRALAFAVSDSVGYIVGAYRYSPSGGDTGKFVLALRRSGAGPWRIAADIDNTNSRGRPSP